MEINFTKIDWNKYGEFLEKLWINLQKYLSETNTSIDAIVPILREGAFTGFPLAYKLNTYKVIPIQFKYKLLNGSADLLEIAELPGLHYELPENPVILVTDTVASCGKTGLAAAKKIKERWSTSRLIYASLLQDFESKKPAEYEAMIYGIQTDEENKLSAEEAKEKGVDKTFYLMPWENEEEERNSILQKEYNYD